MDVDASTVPQTYTILRIKRKRNEEPLDALVVESRVRRKKSRGGVGVFQYAHTVEGDAWKDEQSQKDLQDRISRLAKEDAVKLQEKPEVTRPDSEIPSSPIRSKKAQTPRYTVVSADEQEPPAKRRMTNLPKASSPSDPPKNPPIRMYDAVPSKAKSIQASETDPEMEKFLPMLKDYLKIHDISPNSPISSTAATPKVRSGTPAGDDESGDYVWDVFYHRPVTLSEWNSVAARTGTLTGLPASLLDSDESGSDSEAEDEADEDSNAEEYYKNDYPDEETDSEPDHSGEFHARSWEIMLAHCGG